MQKPKVVMIWACVTHKGKGLLTFIEEGAKITRSMFSYSKTKCCRGRRTPPSHCARQTQAWLQANVPDWITPQQWPPYSSDENGLDYSIWGYLEAKACEKPHNSITTLKKAIRKDWNEMLQDLVQQVVDAWSFASMH
uniref:Transposase n=1 Tax=Acrobeloides nanus TaxID=290746 RepID=A0A914CAV7_9BILA